MPWDDWIRTVEVEPSLYAADFAHLADQIETLLRAEVKIFHFDVGDGQFVPPITMGPIVLQSIAPIIHDGGGIVDVHLMIVEPQRHFSAFAEAGADSVTVHHEVCEDLPAVVAQARELELEVGLAFNPQTAPEEAAEAAEKADVDLALCMSIQPGYSGQELLPESFRRIRTLRALLPSRHHVQVDGGVGPENIRELREAGANLFVAGTSIFGREDLPRAYRRLVQALA